MKKAKKKQYKWVSEDTLANYKSLSQNALITELTKKHKAYLEECKKKRSDLTLKDLADDIKDFHKNYENREPQKAKEIEDLVAQLAELRAERDQKILDAIEEKKALEGGYRDNIASLKEHRDLLLKLLA